MTDTVKVLDVVVLTEDVPARGLVRGQVGTIVEELGADSFEVEFSDDEGRAYAIAPLRAHQLLVLRYQPAEAA